MGKTAMQKLLEFYQNSNALMTTTDRLIDVINDHLKLEREQITNAYNSGKNYPDDNGDKYYFLNYITND
jgi:hypothetical protein